MNVRLISLIACAAIAPAFFSVAQAQAQVYFNGFEDYSLGALGTQGLARGLYAESTDGTIKNVTVVSGNSAFAPSGTKSARIFNTAGGTGSRLRLYFADRTIGSDQVTGALGRNLSGNYAKSLTFSWDFIGNTRLDNNATFGFYDASGGTFQPVNAAVIFDIRWNSLKLQYANGIGTFSLYDDYVFKVDTWYNFVVSNIDTSSQTYDLLVYENGVSDAVVTISGAGFYANIAEIEAFRMSSNSTASYSYGMDNFTITQIPESGTYAMLLGFSAVALLGLRRRFKK